jgi:non-ribosomal peptide synthetase component F
MFHAAWALAVMVDTGARDILYGNIVSGRADARAEVGVLDQNFPKRVRVEDSDLLGDWLRRIRSSVVESLRYETLPRPNLRDLGAARFGSVMTSLDSLGDALGDRDVTPTLRRRHGRIERRSLVPPGVTVITLAGSDLSVVFNYTEATCEPKLLAQTFAQFEVLLEALVESATDRPVVELLKVTARGRGIGMAI